MDTHTNAGYRQFWHLDSKQSREGTGATSSGRLFHSDMIPGVMLSDGTGSCTVRDHRRWSHQSDMSIYKHQVTRDKRPTFTVSCQRIRSPARPETSFEARSNMSSVCSAFRFSSSFWASFSSYCCFSSAIFAST